MRNVPPFQCSTAADVNKPIIFKGGRESPASVYDCKTTAACRLAGVSATAFLSHFFCQLQFLHAVHLLIESQISSTRVFFFSVERSC